MILKNVNNNYGELVGVKPTTSASGSKPSGNTTNNRITRPPSSNQKNNVEDHSKKVKSSLNKMNSISKPNSNALVKHSVRNAKFEYICAIYNQCLFDANHDMCNIDYVNDVNVVQIVLWYLDSGSSKHMTGNRSQLINFVSKFLGTVRFGNDHIAKIMGYGDYQIGNVTISRDSCIALTTFADADHVGCQDTRKSTSGSMQLLGDRLKEEIFQVVIDLIKNSKCFKAFTISADVLEIFMQQFWTILDICLRVEGVDFTDVPDDDATLAFLTELRYKGPLYKHTNMFVDHMHQPWSTLAAIINKCLFGKTTSNDKLRKSRIDILWGMFYKENVDYPGLIWEDLAFQIDHIKEKISRRKNMPFPRFTKVIINYFLRKHNSLSNLKYQHYYIIKDDGIVSRLRFVRIGKGSQGKKTTDTHVADVDVSEESNLEPPKRKTARRRVVKKKVTISADDNIISDDPDIALELGKSINKIEVEEAEATRQVYATHSRIVTESVPEPTRKRKSGKVTSDPPKRLKGVPSLTIEEQEVANTMQALKESRTTSRRQRGTRGSNEGTGPIPRVPDESIIISTISSEGTGTKPEVLDEEKDNKDGDANDEGDNHISDTQDDDNDEDDETESDVDEIYKYQIHVRKDVDAEMAELETVEHENKEKDVLTDAAKPDVEKNAEEEGDAEKTVGFNFQVKESTEFPLPSSSLSVSSGFGTQFFNSSFDISLTGVLKDTAEADVSSLVDIHIQQETPQI
ncbi:hypothetical protein Tco_1145518 [Tanacetum coccineum]